MLPHPRHALAVPAALFLAICGCSQSTPTAAPPKPPEVHVARPVVKEVTDFEVFTGRTDAVQAVDVRARVTGYLDRTLFKDGADVKAGEVLFEIDPRTYAAEAERARGTLAQAEAHLKRLGSDYDRAVNLFARNAIGREEVDRIVGDRAEAQAAVSAAKAGVQLAELNLGFTKVTAPFDGRISRRMVDPGNLVKADDTVLTHIVALDPLYVYFDIDERTLLRLRRLIREGKMPSAREKEVSVGVGLADEDGFSLSAVIDFGDNRLDAGSGTLRVRARLVNPQRLLSPGLFVRVRLPIGPAHKALLVPEEALGSDQGQRYLLVLDDKDNVEYRRVEIGSQHDGLRVIEKGVGENDRLIVTGLQRVRPKQKAVAKLVDVPGVATAAGTATKAGEPSAGR
jgi:RND family efflux transporter MFP subunit